VAAEISAAVRRQTEVVGVFVNASLGEVTEAAENASLSMVQLHGDEGPAFCREAARRTGCRVIKAVQVRSAAEVQAAEVYRTDFHLFDAHHPARRGGTGESFDWELLAGRRSAVPAMLSGGLTPENVAEAIGIVRPNAVDVVSGVEREPGTKDYAQMAAFFEAAQSVSAATEALHVPDARARAAP
jgi:phosphoribosylanthranilate isomerase